MFAQRAEWRPVGFNESKPGSIVLFEHDFFRETETTFKIMLWN